MGPGSCGGAALGAVEPDALGMSLLEGWAAEGFIAFGAWSLVELNGSTIKSMSAVSDASSQSMAR